MTLESRALPFKGLREWVIQRFMEPYTVYVGPGTYSGRFELPDGTERIVGTSGGKTMLWISPYVYADEVSDIVQF